MAAMKARRDVKVENLHEVPLFAGLLDGGLRRVAAMADEVAVPAGYVLVYDGQWSGEVFVIVSGRAEIAPGEAVHHVAGAGDVVGELPLVEPALAGATVTAASPMRFFVFDQEGFSSLLVEFPLLAQRVAAQRVAAQRVSGPRDGTRRAGAWRTRSGTADRQPAYPGFAV